ncbi:ribonuclease HI [Breoghania sp.]|uniref:ribonuclease HI n=1 Tax=Breoghania sp. TaxID=2065378 RepID=UPI002AA926C8|nr:ribonuclease HI [Breoghania sp.]
MASSSPSVTHIVIHTDGACSGNPGPGGWGAIVCYWSGDTPLDRIELSGGEADTTNNRMELSAAAIALNRIRERDWLDPDLPVTIVSDSEYLVKGFTQWRYGWRRRGWRTASGQPVKNLDLWQGLEFLAAGLSLSFEWVRGHTGNPENEAADALAVAAIPHVADA